MWDTMMSSNMDVYWGNTYSPLMTSPSMWSNIHEYNIPGLCCTAPSSLLPGALTLWSVNLKERVSIPFFFSERKLHSQNCSGVLLASPGAGPVGGIEGVWSGATKFINLFNSRVWHWEVLGPQVITNITTGYYHKVTNTNFVSCRIQNNAHLKDVPVLIF